ncbi:MAG TPA: PDZ domain-containing protein [Methylomirabilota bacterium]|nr:PDZ domain-containing protein [Methylomirabilota bacterium]
MNCVCGHPEKDHALGSRCRVPDCPCELFRPGDTLGTTLRRAKWVGLLGRGRPRWGGPSAAALLTLIALLIAVSGLVGAAEDPPPPASLARVAAAARAASIVIRMPGAVGGDAATDEWPDLTPLDEEPELFDLLTTREEHVLAPGVIVDPRGFALTSARAVRAAPAFEVVLLDGTPVKAELLALDRRTDVAVLKLEPDGASLPYLPLGDSNRVNVGEWVIAVGAPMGLEGTVTAGVVTATPAHAGPSPGTGFLQTDAAMGTGYAGGPIVSLGGEIVGLGTTLSSEGIAYAQPSRSVRKIYLELLEKGRVSRPWLGVTAQTLSPELARALGAPDAAGVVVVDAHPGSPGGRAGLRSGDVVVTVDTTPISSRAQLERVIGTRSPGRVVTLGVRRAVRELTVRVKLGEEPDDWALPPALVRARRLLGFDARPIAPTLGVRVAYVEPASPAARTGIAAGDVIREIDRHPIRAMADLQAAVRTLEPRMPVAMLVQRADVALYVVVVPGP